MVPTKLWKIILCIKLYLHTKFHVNRIKIRHYPQNASPPTGHSCNFMPPQTIGLLMPILYTGWPKINLVRQLHQPLSCIQEKGLDTNTYVRRKHQICSLSKKNAQTRFGRKIMPERILGIFNDSQRVLAIFSERVVGFFDTLIIC